MAGQHIRLSLSGFYFSCATLIFESFCLVLKLVLFDYKKSQIVLFVSFSLFDVNIFNTSQNLYMWMVNTSNNISYFTTNGLLNPVMKLCTGQTKRFR